MLSKYSDLCIYLTCVDEKSTKKFFQPLNIWVSEKYLKKIIVMLRTLRWAKTYIINNTHAVLTFITSHENAKLLMMASGCFIPREPNSWTLLKTSSKETVALTFFTKIMFYGILELVGIKNY